MRGDSGLAAREELTVKHQSEENGSTETGRKGWQHREEETFTNLTIKRVKTETLSCSVRCDVEKLRRLHTQEQQQLHEGVETRPPLPAAASPPSCVCLSFYKIFYSYNHFCNYSNITI